MTVKFCFGVMFDIKISFSSYQGNYFLNKLIPD